MVLVNKEDVAVTREWLIGLLAEQTATVTFTKKDGTERVMNCTLKADDVEYGEKKTERTKEPNPEVLPVYDTDAKGWRSFRIDSITSINFTLGE